MHHVCSWLSSAFPFKYNALYNHWVLSHHAHCPAKGPSMFGQERILNFYSYDCHGKVRDIVRGISGTGVPYVSGDKNINASLKISRKLVRNALSLDVLSRLDY